MPSSKMSLNLNKLKIKFSISLYASLLELYYVENPVKIEHPIRDNIAILVMPKTKNK